MGTIRVQANRWRRVEERVACEGSARWRWLFPDSDAREPIPFCDGCRTEATRCNLVTTSAREQTKRYDNVMSWAGSWVSYLDHDPAMVARTPFANAVHCRHRRPLVEVTRRKNVIQLRIGFCRRHTRTAKCRHDRIA